ncbi:MAG: hypothetical protein ACFCVG_02005 [Kineosporiaceae bacterium]
MLRAETGDLLEFLAEGDGPAAGAGPAAPAPDLTSLPVPELLDHVAGAPAATPADRDRLSRSLDRTGLGVPAAAAAAALDLAAWPQPDEVTAALAEPLVTAAAVARLADRVLGATAAAAAGSGRPDVAWVLALAPRPVPFYVRLGAGLAADPDLDARLREVLGSLAGALGGATGTSAPVDPVAVAAQFAHRVPAATVSPPTLDLVVELLVAGRRRGSQARGLVEATVGLLARLDRAAAPAGGCRSCGGAVLPADAPDPVPLGTARIDTARIDTTRIDTTRIAEARHRQARIDGTRTAVALLTELQSYPPPPRDPRGIWRDLADVARGHGVGPIGEHGEEVLLDPERHELLDDDLDDDLDDKSEPSGGSGEPDGPDGPDARTARPAELADRPVRIVRSGYTWAHGEEVVVLQRALVRLVNRG